MTRTRPMLGVGLILLSGALFAINGTVSKVVMRAGFDAPRLTLLVRPGFRHDRTAGTGVPAGARIMVRWNRIPT